ncbi:lipopolysaccharide biosynthesis protein [Marivirga sp.]|uniref:lipopolysaccharide biosynthesis protein n=1 Tax=Marivirga sp. TaxID=2018662 RepID=UPI002D7E45F1|nr:lipopolysaccharide biosynthesis protein [Marivirga sp.]HET8860550.1 lipopolysaccharide biosynthesis protein [Marivirga sp.]
MSSLKKRSVIAYAWNMGGMLIRQGSSFIISIFLARLLEPAEFGLVGMAMVFISISQVFIDVGFGSALIQNQKNTNLTYSSVFYVNLVAGLILTGLFYFIAPYLGQFYENEQITDIVRWLSLVFIFSSLNQVQTNILKKKLNFKVLTVRGLVAGISSGVLGVILAFQGFGVYALVIQSLTGAALGTILLWSTSGWRPDLKFSFSEVKKLTGFSAYVFFDRFVSTIFQKLDILLIGKLFSPASLGFYTRAVSLKDQVTKYSSNSLRSVFFPVLSELQEDHKEYSRIYFKVVSVITFLSYGLTGILYILGGNIILILFGDKWEPSISIFQVLILGVANYPLSSMMVNAFMSKGKSKLNFWIGVLRKSIRIIPLIIAYVYGIYEFTVAVVIVSYLLTLINMLFLKKFVKLPLGFHLRKVFEGLTPLIPFVVLFHFFEFDSLLKNILLALSFSFCYLGYNYLIKTEGLRFILANSIKIRSKYLK